MDVPLKRFRIVKFRGKTLEYVEDEIATELPIVIYINGRILTTLYATPRELMELAIGCLMTEGLVRDLGEIIEVHILGSSIYITLPEPVEGILKQHSSRCSGIPEMEYGQPSEIHEVESNIKWTYVKILKVVEKLNSNAILYRRTGGVHVAMIINSRGFEILCEDVGRHNVVDKVIGAYVLKGFRDFNSTLLAVSGRLSYEIVLKAARMNIPVLVSTSAPTSLGVALAERSGITLVGFVRGENFNVYTHPERITWDI